MDNFDDRYLMPFGVGSELGVESFKLAQYDNTYMLASPRYYQFYASYVRPRVLMYKGWIEGFHNTEYGVLPSLFLQKIGNGIVNTVFGKPAVLNTENKGTNLLIESKRFKKSGLIGGIKDVFGLAVGGGTALAKWNKDGNGDLRLETVPMEKFFIEVDSYGDIERVKSFISTYYDTISASQEFHLCEERFFKYATVGGVRKRFPMVHYNFYKTSSNIASETVPAPSDSISWKDVPADVRNMLMRDYGDILIDDYDGYSVSERAKKCRSDGEAARLYDKCKLLPFDDDLGCRLIKFTSNIPAFSKLPFGQPIADLLMNESYAYDQLKFFERLEVYIARGRVMLDDGQTNPNDPESRKSIFDPAIFTKYANALSGKEENKPFGIQLDLRAENIRVQKQNILNDAAFALNLSSSTIAAWLSDGTTQKTATEIEYERTKTEGFINDKIEIIQEPLQELIDIYFHYHGVTSPELHIMPENQTVRSESIRLHSELYEKGQVTSKILAEKILGTCSVKEVNELALFIDTQKQMQQSQPLQQLTTPPIAGGAVESPVVNMPSPK